MEGVDVQLLFQKPMRCSSHRDATQHASRTPFCYYYNSERRSKRKVLRLRRQFQGQQRLNQVTLPAAEAKIRDLETQLQYANKEINALKSALEKKRPARRTKAQPVRPKEDGPAIDGMERSDFMRAVGASLDTIEAEIIRSATDAECNSLNAHAGSVSIEVSSSQIEVVVEEPALPKDSDDEDLKDFIVPDDYESEYEETDPKGKGKAVDSDDNDFLPARSTFRDKEKTALEVCMATLPLIDFLKFLASKEGVSLADLLKVVQQTMQKWIIDFCSTDCYMINSEQNLKSISDRMVQHSQELEYVTELLLLKFQADLEKVSTAKTAETELALEERYKKKEEEIGADFNKRERARVEGGVVLQRGYLF